MFFLVDHTVGYVLIYPLPLPLLSVSNWGPPRLHGQCLKTHTHSHSVQWSHLLCIWLSASPTLLCMKDNSQRRICVNVCADMYVCVSVRLSAFSTILVAMMQWNSITGLESVKDLAEWLSICPVLSVVSLLTPTLSQKEGIIHAIPCLLVRSG